VRPRRRTSWGPSELRPRAAGPPFAATLGLAALALPALACTPAPFVSGLTDAAAGGPGATPLPILVETPDATTPDDGSAGASTGDAAAASDDAAGDDVASDTPDASPSGDGSDDAGDAGHERSCAAPGTGAVAVAGCPCFAIGALACAGNAQAAQLLCRGGTWTPTGTCPAGALCDTRLDAGQGTCAPVPAACASAAPAQLVCLDTWTVGQCGPDTASVTFVRTCQGQVCSAGQCAGQCAPPVDGGTAARCSGTKVETCGASGQWGTAQSCPSGCCLAACVDLATDGRNCASCGHDCQGGACSASACQAVTVEAPYPWATAVAVDARNVYYTTPDSVYQRALTGGSAVPLASGRSASPYAIAVDATSVYWTEEGSGGPDGLVMKAPIGGGAATTLATGQAMPLSLAVDAIGVYWAESGALSGQGAVHYAPLGGTGGGPAPTLAAGQPAVWGIATDPDGVYFTTSDCGQADGGACSGAVMKVQRGGAPVTLVSGQPGAAGIAVAPAAVFWTTSQCHPAGDGGTSCSGSIASAGLDGGAPVTLASGGGAGGIVVDAQNVYVTSPSGILRVPVAGGALTTLAPDPNPNGSLAQDGTTLYWTDLVCASATCTGSVQKVAKP
jgi:hypothetical protein